MEEDREEGLSGFGRAASELIDEIFRIILQVRPLSCYMIVWI